MITVKASAKINLTLDVVRKRADGYHDLKSVMQSVGIYEYLRITENTSKKITVSCDKSDIPCDDSNIAVKCADIFFKETGKKFDGLHIDIQKNIPAQAGLAGGSADGAGVLFGINEMYGKPFSQEELITIGAKIGADIPFCLIGGTVLAEGIGEKLTKLENIPECIFVIVKPSINISTSQAYKAVDAFGMNKSPSTDIMLNNLVTTESIARNLHNDFEQALQIPELLDITNKLKNFDGSLGACMSGSGSAVFAIFDDSEKADFCASQMRTQYPFAQTAKPTSKGIEIL